MDDLLAKVGVIVRKVFDLDNPLAFLNPDVWREVLGKPEMFWAAIVVLNAIVFTETGLLIGFLLPGDSLLVVAGFVANQSGWNLPILIGTLCVSAIVGDSVGYWIGAKAGPRIFSRPDGIIFRQSYIQSAKDFYDRHGGKTVILARFVPIVRTFAPVVAGAGKMNYRTFLAYNVVGGVLWVTSMILIGYFLIDLLDPALKPVFGPNFTIAKHIDKIVVVIIVASVLPMLVKAVNGWRKRKATPPESAAAVTV